MALVIDRSRLIEAREHVPRTRQDAQRSTKKGEKRRSVTPRWQQEGLGEGKRRSKERKGGKEDDQQRAA